MEARSARKPTHKFLADRPFLYFITTIKEPVDPSKPSMINKEDYLFPEGFIFPSECSTEPFNLLFVGTFC
uniref:Uncharacterized protein n=1 Tax=Panagrolaimus davidi TaxID=227884 RepID=A0A914QVR4_9BILA